MNEWAAQWGRFLAVPAAIAEANLELFETLVSTPIVIAARVPTIQAAIANPLDADHSELNRMVVEKGAALKKAASSAGSDLMTLSRLGIAGGTPALQRMWDPVNAMTEWMRFWNVVLRLPSRSHAPIHRTVKANRRRLSRV